MGEVIMQAKPPHVCRPVMEETATLFNKSMQPYSTVPQQWTVWRCDCGRLWETMKSPYRNNNSWRWFPARLSTTIRVWWRNL